MKRETEISTSDDSAEAAADGTARAVVVVQYRKGWVASLTVPVLILVAAAAILSHRLRFEDWRGLMHYMRGSRPVAAAPAPPSPAPSVPMAPAGPLVLKVLGPEGPPVPTAVAEAAIAEVVPPAPWPAPSSSRIRPPLAIASALPATEPTPELPIKPEEVWEDIRRESARLQEQATALEAEKDQQFDAQQRMSEQKRSELDRAEQKDRDRERATFHDALRRALVDSGGRPGQAIRFLCRENGVTIGASWRGASIAEIGKVPSTTGRREKVDRMRLQGSSEALILDELIRLQDRNRVARGGAKSQEEAIVRAARQLLALPLTPAPGPARARRP